MAEPDEGPDGCVDGMRHVTDVWARQEAGIDRDADLEALRAQAATERAALEDARMRRARGVRDPDGKLPEIPDTPTIDTLATYARALNTVFPCPTHRPDQFRRWRNGCWRPGHRAKSCRLCNPGKAAA